MGYELLLAAGGEPCPPLPIKPAPNQDFERAMDDLSNTLLSIGFLPEHNSGHWFMNVKKIFRRSYLSRGECDLIQGICRQIRWKAGIPKNNAFNPVKTLPINTSANDTLSIEMFSYEKESKDKKSSSNSLDLEMNKEESSSEE
jgi:hypothetical protein